MGLDLSETFTEVVARQRQGVTHQKSNADPATVRVVLSGPTQDQARGKSAALVSESQPDGLDIDGIAMAK